MIVVPREIEDNVYAKFWGAMGDSKIENTLWARETIHGVLSLC